MWRISVKRIFIRSTFWILFVQFSVKLKSHTWQEWHIERGDKKLPYERHEGIWKWSTAPVILNLETRWRGQQSASRSGRFIPVEKSPIYPVAKVAGWAPEPVRTMQRIGVCTVGHNVTPTFFDNTLDCHVDFLINVLLRDGEGGAWFKPSALLVSEFPLETFDTFLYIWVRASWIEFNNFPTRCDLFSLLHFCRQLYMFRVFTPIIRSWYSCNYSFWYWLTGSTTIRCRCWAEHMNQFQLNNESGW